ncbi:MAG TPA: hypothetical protein VNO21_19095, partial [Polyangiaceae bacterium]|nr:hypothetical protein [Polyangiaceae bacterium]
VRLVGDRIFVLEVIRDANESSTRRLAVYARHGEEGAPMTHSGDGANRTFGGLGLDVLTGTRCE